MNCSQWNVFDEIRKVSEENIELEKANEKLMKRIALLESKVDKESEEKKGCNIKELESEINKLKFKISEFEDEKKRDENRLIKNLENEIKLLEAFRPTDKEIKDRSRAFMDFMGVCRGWG